jgi:hypothetical protein
MEYGNADPNPAALKLAKMFLTVILPKYVSELKNIKVIYFSFQC